MRKKHVMLCIAALFVSFTANAYILTFEVDGIKYTTVTGGVKVIGFNKNAKNLILNGTVTYDSKVYNVINIADDAFIECNTLTNVGDLPACTSIGEFAFQNCSNLTSIGNLPACTSIQDCAISICPSLTSVGNLSACTSIGEGAFWDCTSLKSVGDLSACKSIGDCAFEECTSLTSVGDLPACTSIGEGAFWDCTSLKSVGDLPACTSIGGWAFQNCTSLTSIGNLPACTSIQKYAISKCPNLTSVGNLSACTSIGEDAFWDCTSLKSVGNLSACKSIGNKAFRGCKNLTSIENLSACKSIGDYAFYDCCSLTSISIPESMTSIGEYAFYGCTGLTSVHISDLAAWCKITFNGNSSTTNPLHYAKHLFLNGEEISDLIIPNNVVSIGKWAFWNCQYLNALTIGANVKSIGMDAFSNCSGLTNIKVDLSNLSYNDGSGSNCIIESSNNQLIVGCKNTVIPNSVTSIGTSAFRGRKSLTSMLIPNSVTNIYGSAFMGCSSLASVTIPDFVTNIDYRAFRGCIGLTSISIPNAVTNIGQEAFYGCTNLTRLSICENIASIGVDAFSGCNIEKLIFAEGCTKAVSTGLTNVSEVILPQTLQTISDNAFANFANLKTITIPSNVTSIGNGAFAGCTGLRSITTCSENLSLSGVFLDSKNIEKLIYAEGCTKAVSTGLTSVSDVSLPETLQTIEASAFYNFRNLKTITIPQSVTSIGQQAFYGCAALASVTMENNNLTEIYQSSFPSQAKLYVKRGTKTLLTLWKNGYTGSYEIGTGNRLPPSSLSVENTTQMTATVKVNDYYDGFTYTLNDEPIGKNAKTFYAPYPGYKYSMPLKITLDDITYSTQRSFQTKGLNMKAERTGGTASSMTVKASYEHGDAPVTAQTLSLGGVTVEDDEIYLNGLKPNTSYTVTYVVWINNEYAIRENFKFRTDAYQFTASQPKVISEGNVIIASKSNLDDRETNVGFEWRRTDWTSEFPSNRAGAYLYEGMMEGYIRNLNTNYLWKYRPYYETQDGSRFYGDWTGIDPTNTSYFEPTVHTYDKVEVNGNRARVKGYAMRGSDNIVSQGFRYWRSTESASRAKQVEADGQVMSIELKGLDYHTTYRVVAFVTTSEGKTYYGKEQLFTTGDPTGIEETFADEPQKITEEGIYDLSGRKLERMQKGINIIRKADGTTKKVLVK